MSRFDKALPSIIDEPGRYVTRSGELVEVISVDGSIEFGVIGYYIDDEVPDVDVWNINGRISINSESEDDIVKKEI